MRNDPGWASEPGHGDDNRWANRPRVPWQRNLSGESAADRDDPSTVAGRVFTGMRALARARAGLPHLHASVATQPLDCPHTGVLAVLRPHPHGPMLALYNVTEHHASVPAWLLDQFGLLGSVDRVGGDPVLAGPAGEVTLAPYAVLWVV